VLLPLLLLLLSLDLILTREYAVIIRLLRVACHDALLWTLLIERWREMRPKFESRARVSTLSTTLGPNEGCCSALRLRTIPTDGELAPRQHYPPLLLGLARGHDLTCAEVKALTEQHIADIRGKIRDLRKLDRVLSELAGKCRGSTVPDCPILDALQNSSPAV
jgi:hypothetical protein